MSRKYYKCSIPKITKLNTDKNISTHQWQHNEKFPKSVTKEKKFWYYYTAKTVSAHIIVSKMTQNFYRQYTKHECIKRVLISILSLTS